MEVWLWMSIGWVYILSVLLKAQAVAQKLAGEQPYGQVCRGGISLLFPVLRGMCPSVCQDGHLVCNGIVSTLGRYSTRVPKNPTRHREIRWHILLARDGGC